MLVKKIVTSVKVRLFPSEHQLMVKKWYADDYDGMRYNYILNKDAVVLDIGGYKGQFASDIFARYCCHIYVFEPVTAFAENIRNRFRENSSIQAFAYGLGGSSRSETIHLSADSSSIYGKSGNLEKIEIVDIKKWIIDNAIDHIDLMKINIEGGEYELLDRLIETKQIDIIDNLQVQFHNTTVDARSRMTQIQRELEKTHAPTYQYEFVWENWKRKEARNNRL